MNGFQRILLISTVLTVPLAHAQDIRTSHALLRAMHERYQASWYKTLTFTQKNTTYKPDGMSTAETWYEAAMLPGRLRIDIGPPASGNGYVLVDGTATIVKDGKVADTFPLINMLLVFGFDVYTQDPDATIAAVKGQGYDLSKGSFGMENE